MPDTRPTTIKLVEQIVGLLARELSQATANQVLIETQRQKLFGSDIIELRVLLRALPYDMPAEPWLWHYRRNLVPVLNAAGLELAVDDWFIPSQRFPSCSCWIKCPNGLPESKKTEIHESRKQRA